MFDPDPEAWPGTRPTVFVSCTSDVNEQVSQTIARVIDRMIVRSGVRVVFRAEYMRWLATHLRRSPHVPPPAGQEGAADRQATDVAGALRTADLVVCVCTPAYVALTASAPELACDELGVVTLRVYERAGYRAPDRFALLVAQTAPGTPSHPSYLDEVLRVDATDVGEAAAAADTLARALYAAAERHGLPLGPSPRLPNVGDARVDRLGTPAGSTGAAHTGPAHTAAPIVSGPPTEAERALQAYADHLHLRLVVALERYRSTRQAQSPGYGHRECVQLVALAQDVNASLGVPACETVEVLDTARDAMQRTPRRRDSLIAQEARVAATEAAGQAGIDALNYFVLARYRE